MLLGDLIEGLAILPIGAADRAIRVCDITEDSRTVLPGSLFIARAGTKADGRRFIEQAIDCGAVAVLTTPASVPANVGNDIAWLTSDDLLAAEAALAERFYGHPSRSLTLIGVTGTNGKTTTTHLVHQLLNASRLRCGLIGTVSIDDGGGVSKAAMTTPPALELSHSLARMVEHGYKAAAIEVSSHALDQQRVAAMDFDVGVFTNLTGDHLDYHGTMEAYLAAKSRLFIGLRPDAAAVVNADDPSTERLLRGCRARVVRCSMVNSGAECRAEFEASTADGTRVTLAGPWGRIQGRVPLIGAHNVMNCLQAAACAHEAGVPASKIQAALDRLAAPPGRLEVVTRRPGVRESFSVFVDYSHSDDSLTKALQTLRPLADQAGGRLSVVFGCGGDKDRTKRPRMGRVAATLADRLIVTSDNPRTEDPMAIIRQILEGIEGQARMNLRIEPDRRAAIALAVSESRPGDVVLIAGKGHEDYQLLPDGEGGIKRIDFDDRVVVREALVAALGDRKHATHSGATKSRQGVTR